MLSNIIYKVFRMKWDQDIFLRNIEKYLAVKFDGNQTKFNNAIDSRDAITRWKKGDRNLFCKLYLTNIQSI